MIFIFNSSIGIQTVKTPGNWHAYIVNFGLELCIFKKILRIFEAEIKLKTLKSESNLTNSSVINLTQLSAFLEARESLSK